MALAIGDVFYALDNDPRGRHLLLRMFVLVALALLQLTRGGAILVDRARLIDLLAFACSTLLVVWVFVIGEQRPARQDLRRRRHRRPAARRASPAG